MRLTHFMVPLKAAFLGAATLLLILLDAVRIPWASRALVRVDQWLLTGGRS